jgi:3-oxoacyl-[acyl-carrier-protein] synthase-3
MNAERRVGLLGVATYLPPIRRTNDWWPDATVQRWRQAPRRLPPLAEGEPTPAMTRVLAAMAEQDFDPFQGVTERRVLPDEMSSLEMEVQAAQLAIERAGIDRREIDLLLTHTAVPDYLLSNTACVLHRELGLASACFTMQVEASGYSFLTQLTLAEQIIAAGRARYALLVQSCASSRLIDREDSESALHGDAAAAVVVGPASGGGVLATAHRTDGTQPRALVASVRDGRWYDGGRIHLHRADPRAAARIFLETADRAIEVVRAALNKAGVAPGKVDFFAVHQGTPWLRRVTQESIGLDRARSVDTFSTTGYLFGASIPLVLETAQRRSLLGRDDIVVMHGGGVGSTYGAIVMRWGEPVA